MVPCAQRNDLLTMVRHWAKCCVQGKHVDCQKYRNQARIVPSKLLYLDPDLPGVVQLIGTNNGRQYQYVTLSHRWGVHPFPEPLKLSSLRTCSGAQWISVHELRVGISESRLPRSFRDALNIARSCQIEYAWIDCLCVAQDKSPQGINPDWDREAGNMGNIYAGGLLYVFPRSGLLLSLCGSSLLSRQIEVLCNYMSTGLFSSTCLKYVNKLTACATAISSRRMPSTLSKVSSQ